MCTGSPDLIIEVLPVEGSRHRGMPNKFDLYEEAGVLEYWVIDPER